MRATFCALWLLMLVACQAGSPTAAPTASVVPSTPEPSASAELPILSGWQVIPIGPEGAYSVAEATAGWVAVGNRRTGVEHEVWYSDDGESWTPIDQLPVHDGSLWEVVSVGQGFIAMGSTTEIDFGTPYLWSSSDGREWIPASLGLTETDYGHIKGIAQIGGQLFAGGGLIGERGPGFGPAVMWRSTDGVAWSMTYLDSLGAGGASVVDPVEFAGQLVTVGSAYTPRIGLVWTSSDGAAWSVQRDTAEWVNAHVWGLAVVGERLVVFGALWDDTTGSSRPAIWSSPDGTNWSFVDVGPCCGIIQTVDVLDGQGYAFAGNIVYRSTDGGGWELAGAIEGFDGEVAGIIDSTVHGRAAIGRTPNGLVLLVPPAD